eukprot:802145-Pelagomonas_calceolata.AAC.1
MASRKAKEGMASRKNQAPQKSPVGHPLSDRLIAVPEGTAQGPPHWAQFGSLLTLLLKYLLSANSKYSLKPRSSPVNTC